MNNTVEPGLPQSTNGVLHSALNVGPTWNTWFRRNRDDDDPPLTSLAVSKDITYKFLLDVSSLPYETLVSGMVSGPVDIRLKTKIQRLIAKGEKELKLKIRPVVVGDELEIIDRQTTYNLTLDLERLDWNQTVGKTLIVSASWNAGLENSLSYLLDTLSAGAINFEVIAKKSGCAMLGMSVWDQTGIEPLDHLIVQIPVFRAGEKIRKCDSKQLQSGFSTLLDKAVALGGEEQSSVDAALHIFEVEKDNETTSVAIFVDAEAVRKATPPNQGVYTWQMRSLLSEYVTQDSQLKDTINKARKKATEGFDPHPYADVAAEIAKKVFTRRESVAQDALASLNRIAENSDGRAIKFLTRAVSSNNQLLYLPFGLLSASSERRIVNGDMVVTQPLPNEARVTSEETCIDSWAFGIPEALDQVQPAELLIERVSRPWLGWHNDINSIEQYFGRNSQLSNRGEGLLLLAHHDSGSLWFQDTDRKIGIDDLLYNYPSGSVGMFAACSATGVDARHRRILEELNTLGMETIIASPFQVRTDYGVRLALEFANAVRLSRENNVGATISELFQQASTNTARFFDDTGSKLSEMSLEFMVLGNHELALCTE